MKLNDEIICGYKVSSKMKRIWNVELRLLNKFVSVCNSYGLKYRLSGGTLLGAVRHNGFIPWDNDIDVVMFRDDFNKLIEIGSKEFCDDFYFQSTITENGKYFSSWIKIRDNHSTAGCKEDFDLGLHCGIYIDVFCLDEIPSSSIIQHFFFYRLHFIKKMTRFTMNRKCKEGLINKLKYKVNKILYYMIGKPNNIDLFNLYQKEAGKYNKTGCSKLGLLDFGYDKCFIWDKEDYISSIKHKFMDNNYDIPLGYDNVLRIQYGDYMKIPDDKSAHEYYHFDPDIPFYNYFS